MQNDMENKVNKILKKLDIKSAPVNVEEIAAALSISVKRAPAKNVSGLLFRKDGAAFMALNSEESEVRQRFTIAHELGHFFLHPAKDTFVDFRDNKENIRRGYKEREANSFAAALLMPLVFLKRDAEIYGGHIDDEEVEVLAKKYDVSTVAMTYRLTNLGLISK